MKKKLFIALSIMSALNLCTTHKLFAQNDDSAIDVDEEISNNCNFIKTNLTGIILKNYSLQYERTLNKKISVALQYRMMPTTGIPF